MKIKSIESSGGSSVSEPLRLIGAGEIQDLLKVSRVRTYQLTCRRGFPEPVAELESGRIWLAEDVEDWIRIHRPSAK